MTRAVLKQITHFNALYQFALYRGQCYLPKLKAEADNTDQGINNSGYPGIILQKPNSIIVLGLLFI